MRNRENGALAGWLAVLTMAQVIGFMQVWNVFVRRPHGQLLDTIALTGNSIGQDRVDGVVSTVLNAMSLVSVAAATGVIAVIALLRGRIRLAAVAVGIIVVAGIGAQVLKQAINRPYLGIDPERYGAGNSLPSGHTAVAAAVAVALVLVLPGRLRGLAAVLGAGYAAVVGVATLSAGWHRPSDAVASMLLVGACASAGGLLLLGAGPDVPTRPAATAPGDPAGPGTGTGAGAGSGDGTGAGAGSGTGERAPRDSHPRTVLFLLAAAVVLAGAGALAIAWADPVQVEQLETLSRPRLFAGYAGSAAGISGAAALMMALVLLTAHRVVPPRG